MKKGLLILILGCIYMLPSQAKKPTYVSAEIQGFNGKMVYFDFMEKGDVNMEFPYKENQFMDFSVELDDVTLLKINAWIYVCLQPGDSIHAKIVYDGKSYKTVEYTGTPSAVAVNTALHKMRESQRMRRYKKNIPAALVTLVEAKGYCVETLDERQDDIALLNEVKDQISPRVYNYILSDLDGVFLSNFILYPLASSGFHKKTMEDCLPGNYWDALNDYQLRDDDASLRNEGYVSFLLLYKKYMEHKKAGNKTEGLGKLQEVSKEYAELAAFYDGSLRDAALFALLYNAMANNGDFQVIGKLYKDYLKKYNKNKGYKKILTEVMK